MMTTPATLILSSLAAQMLGGRHWGEGMMGGWWGFGFFWALFWLAIFVLVVVLVWRLVRGGGLPSAPREETPLDILKKRYARGEIDREEFEAKKRDLT